MSAVSERWRDLVSPRVGLVKDVAPQPRSSDEPFPPYLYVATLANFDFRQAERSERLGAGKGRTEEDAVASAIGEAIERYCAYQWDPARTFLARPSELPIPAVTPVECVLFAEAQYGGEHVHHPRWSEGQEISWIRGVELPSGAPAALPASLVYLVSPPPRP